MKSVKPIAIKAMNGLMAEGKKRLSAGKLTSQLKIKQFTNLVMKDEKAHPKLFQLMIPCLTLCIVLSIYFFSPYLKSPKANLLSGNYAAAFSHYIKKANKGDTTAQNIIGNLYLLGLGVEENKHLAARWYLKAALKGNVQAQINLGQSYLNGQGLPRRPLKAMGWFHLARQAGSKRADEHIKYMIYSNLILTNMIQEAKLKFDNLEDVNTRYQKMGETAFLTKMDSSLIEERNQK